MALRIRFCRRRDGVRLAFTTLGSGPPLVWLPGWINHLEVMWERDAYRCFFERLARHRTVILYDKHGVGLSDRDRTTFTLAADVADLEAVLEALSLSQVSLVGNSQAGAVACSFAVDQPSRVDRLILHGAWARQDKADLQAAYDAVLGLIQGHWGLATRVFTDLFVPDADAADRAWFARFQRECADADFAFGMLELCFALDVRPLLPHVRAPTLVLHRDGDRVAHRSHGRELARLIPGASFVKVPGRAHFPWEEDTAPVLDAMERFLGVPTTAGSGEGRSATDPAVSRAATAPGPHRAVLRRDGEVWVVGLDDRTSLLKDVKGLHYLAALLRRPGVESHAVELVAAVEGGRPAATPPGRELPSRRGPDGDLGPVLDRQARQRFRRHLADLHTEVEAARAANDVDRAAALQAEIDAVSEHLASAVGLGGRDRATRSTVERARVKVTRLLRDAIRRIEQVDPELGQLLGGAIRTGTYCVYQPPLHGALRWQL